MLYSGVILDQNCVQLLDTALDDLFLSKNFLSKAVYKYAMNIVVAQVALLYLCWTLPSISKIIPDMDLKNQVTNFYIRF